MFVVYEDGKISRLANNWKVDTDLANLTRDPLQ